MKDLSDICLSYMTEDEQIYISNNWQKFNKNSVCRTVIDNGWLDLLKMGAKKRLYME